MKQKTIEFAPAPSFTPKQATAPFIDVSGATHIGRERAKNTDAFVTADLNRSLMLGRSSLPLSPGMPWVEGTQGKLMIVADGITGAGMGRVASRAAVEKLAHYMATMLPWVLDADEDTEHELAERVTRGFGRCQHAIEHEARRRGCEEQPVGTTLTMAYLVWPRLYVMHVGDSRAYLYRKRKLHQLTADHTIAQRMLDRDMITEERLERTPFRHILTNAVGGDREAIKVEHHSLELAPGDQLLLCTDGLTRHVSGIDLARELDRAPTASLCCDALIRAANDAGGLDNITAVVARVHEAN